MKEIFKNKKVLMAIIGCICGILLIIAGSYGGGTDKNTENQNSELYPSEELEIYTERLEKRICDLVGKVNGVTDVSVLVTIDTSNENVYATSGSNGDFVIVTDPSGKETPVKIMEITANIRGIAVVCDYGGDEALRKNIIEMLSSLFSIGTNRISVMPA